MKKKLTSEKIENDGLTIIKDWLSSKGYAPFGFQLSTWQKFAQGYSGLVIAPTGFGKTYSVFLAIIVDYLNNPKKYKNGVKLLWITPLRSLAKDITKAMQDAIAEIGLDWIVALRNGDTSVKERKEQIKNLPDILVTTPESLHLLFAQKNNKDYFKNLHCIAVDEWHELLGTKRGIMVELSIAYINSFISKIKIWGITATIGNIDEALEVLIPYHLKKTKIIAKEKKKINIIPVLPDEVEVLPWAGHMGSKMTDKIIPIINKSKSTLIFTNTRNQAETWYQNILNACSDFAGQLAIHHSSIDKELRLWIEDSLSNGTLKAVISTSSLDLGVDFKPVDTVIQIGSTKGIARFLQRAGRSGHSPFETSTIYYVPTYSLELIEASALQQAYKNNIVEDKQPLLFPFDVLVQFLVTVAIGNGFYADEMFKTVISTFAYQSITNEEWSWVITFITKGGEIFKNYEEYNRVNILQDGLLKVESKKIAMLHRLNIGTIVSDNMFKVKFLGGGYIGMVEEYFVSKLKEGDAFILGGKVLELVMIKDLTVLVKSTKNKKATAPSWMGGRLPLTSYMSKTLRTELSNGIELNKKNEVLFFLQPLLQTQKEISHIPNENELLVEYIVTKEGYQLFVYPFEGRLVHEVMAALIAFRVSKIKPISFTMAMNDYGFDLFANESIPIDKENIKEIFSKNNLMQDVVSSINAAEMAKRKFRDVACISGLVLQNTFGKQKSNKSLHASSNLIFNVLEEHDKNNLLLKQAYNEVFNEQIEEARLIEAFNRINNNKIVFKEINKYTPLSFPIKADVLRQSLSSEDLATRLRKIQESNFR